jgi:hypothetical protein
MDGVSDQDRQTLLAELAQAREKLDALVRDLRAIDAELEGLALERKQYRLVHEACAALEELRELGAAGLFWGERAADGHAEDQIRRARSRVDGFEKSFGEIEERRQALLEQIEQQQGDTDLLEYDVFEEEEEEERRRQEWIIEREISALPERTPVMPWTFSGEDDRLFRKSLRRSLLVASLLMLVVPHIEIPLPELTEEPIEVPERLVRLMIESRPLPPAPREELRPVPIEQLAQAPPQAAEQVPDRAKPKEGPGKGSGEGPGAGPGKGPASGILAFREKFAGVTETQAVARLGSQARISNAGAASGPVERAMVTTSAPGSSGGINLAALSRGVGGGGGTGSGGGQMAGVQIARATSTIPAGGSGGLGRSVGGGGPLLGRTDEEIQIVFDRHKAALYRLYNRELRRDPTLKGQMILRMTIEPDGSVSLCVLNSSDMNAPQLGVQVVERVRTFDFGAKEGIAAVTILYPIDFLPAV